MEIDVADPKTILVTGASSGIGRAIATLLAERGHSVFGTSRKPSAGEGNIQMLQLDVTSGESVAQCIAEVVKRAGRIDGLVNNAGFGIMGAIEETPIEDAKAQFETNFFGAVRMVKAVLPVMRQQGGGWIINISSLAGRLPAPLGAFYSASKAALRNYSETLRYEVANFGIRVSIIEPGYISTNIMDGMKIVPETKEYAPVRQRLIEQNRKAIKSGADPIVVARRVLKIINSNSPRFAHVVPFSAHILALLRAIAPPALFESLFRKFLHLAAPKPKA